MFFFRNVHDHLIKWKHFPRHWPIVRGIHPSLVSSPTKASNAKLWCFLWSVAEKNGWVINQDSGDLRRHRTHYDVTIILLTNTCPWGQFGPRVLSLHASVYASVCVSVCQSRVCQRDNLWPVQFRKLGANLDQKCKTPWLISPFFFFFFFGGGGGGGGGGLISNVFTIECRILFQAAEYVSAFNIDLVLLSCCEQVDRQTNRD